MSRRIDIEITSVSGESATWRAAGAKLPKGTLSTGLIADGPKVGHVYRAEIEQFMNDIEVLSVAPAKTASPLDPRNERIAIIEKKADGPDVTVTYAPKGRGPRRNGDDRRPRRDGEDRRPSRDGERKPRGEGATRTERPSRREGEDGSNRSSRLPRRDGDQRSARGPRTGSLTVAPVTTTHRNAMLGTLSAEQIPVAEQLFRGGIAAVRSAIVEQNKTLVAQSRPTIDPIIIERMAEDLVGRTALAFWKDRAAGAIGAGKELKLRDLRAVVTTAKTVSHDDESRAMLKDLQTSLTDRIEHMRKVWTEKLSTALASNNLKETLGLIARPPDVSTKVSAEDAAKIVSAVSEALNPSQPAALWNELVALTVETSIRRQVKPVGIPADESSKAVAIKNAGAIPELAKLLGMAVPPPPPPSARPSRPRRSPSRA